MRKIVFHRASGRRERSGIMEIISPFVLSAVARSNSNSAGTALHSLLFPYQLQAPAHPPGAAVVDFLASRGTV